MSSVRHTSFEPTTLQFLEELRAHNNRDWFNANKARYETDVLDVTLRFIDSMQKPLAKIAPRFTAVAKRSGGSLMRIYRDTRFAKDKTPYKTNIGIQFRHEQAKDVHAPGFYLHVDPDQVFIGAGLWRPAADALAGIRARIGTRPDEWRRLVGASTFRRHFSLGGDSLKRPPRGFDKTHPLLDDLRRKDFIAIRELTLPAAVDPRFQRTVERTFAAAAPFMAFLCKAVGVRF